MIGGRSWDTGKTARGGPPQIGHTVSAKCISTRTVNAVTLFFNNFENPAPSISMRKASASNRFCVFG